MSKVRVYEVAKQLNMDQKTLVALFQSMGIGDVRNHMSAVEQDAIERVKRHLERQKTPEVVEERIRPGVIKRRARATEELAPVPSPSSIGRSVPSGGAASLGAPTLSGLREDGPIRRGVPSRDVPSREGDRVVARPAASSPGATREIPPAARSARESALQRDPVTSQVDFAEAAAPQAPAVPSAAPSARGAAEAQHVTAPRAIETAPTNGEAVRTALEDRPSTRGPSPLVAEAVRIGEARTDVAAAPRSSKGARTEAATAPVAPAPASRDAEPVAAGPAPASSAKPSRTGARSARSRASGTGAARASTSVSDLDFDADVSAPSKAARPTEADSAALTVRPSQRGEAKAGEAKASEAKASDAKAEARKSSAGTAAQPSAKTEAASSGRTADQLEEAPPTQASPAVAEGAAGSPPARVAAATPTAATAAPTQESPAMPAGPSARPAPATPVMTPIVEQSSSIASESRAPASVPPRSRVPATMSGSALAGEKDRPTASARSVTQPVTGGANRVSPQPVEGPRRPSSPPKTGIDVWQGRPGVPMPATRTSAPPASRRITIDPRVANTQQPRMGPPGGQGGYQGRPGMMNKGPGGRFGGPPGRPGQRQFGGGSPASKRPPTMQEMAAHKKVIKIEESVSLQKLASMMSLKVTDVLMKLLSMGMEKVNINSTIDSDTAKILASEFGWVVEDVAVSEEQTLEAAMGGVEDEADVQTAPRPPIVTVMGHVDHGKTSLLDRIRKASVAAGEAGGITQHIGAYRVDTPRGTISFLDTPGHEAFTAMRARGAQVTDIVVLVVAADDGVMPQTREAINHAQAAKVPIIVAINKIDKAAADLDRIKRDLSNFGLTPEEWGGETLYCPVSAHTGQGIDQLLEAITLQSEVLELRASQKRRAHGVVIEALLDRGRGPVARVMIQDGTLKTGDILLAGPAWGKVRAMTDELGRSLSSAGPATPVEVLGLNEVPSAGDPVHAVKDAKTAEEIAEGRRKKQTKSPSDSRVSLEKLNERLAEGEQFELKLIIKGDVQGSVEAVAAALTKLSTPKVKVIVVHAAVGAITEGDVNLAVASKAIIVGFNVRPAGKAASLAEGGGVEIRLYNIIYNAVDDIRSAMEGLLPTTKVERALGTAEIRRVFKISKVGAVAGCMVTSGVVKRGADARLVRDGIVVHTGRVSSLRRIKDDVKEVAEGLECGINLENYQDFKEGDTIEAFEVEEVKQKLS